MLFTYVPLYSADTPAKLEVAKRTMHPDKKSQPD